MRAKRRLIAVTAVCLGCAIVFWFSASIRGGQKTYEVQPWITIPEYRTDAARAIDAYEQLMKRNMDLVEGNLTRISVDLATVAKRLESVDAKLTELSLRIARIEKVLGIEQPKSSIPRLQPKTPDKEVRQKPSPTP
jgi:hypothetical protein